VKRPKRVGVLSRREQEAFYGPCKQHTRLWCEPCHQRAVLLAAARRMKRLFGRDDEVVAADILRSWAREIPR